MRTLTKFLRIAALSAAVATMLSVAPAAYSAGAMAGGGMHGGGFGGGGFHGSFGGGAGGYHGRDAAGGFHGGGFHGPIAFQHGLRRGWYGRYGGRGWQNGVWMGDAWAPECEPYSPYFDPDYCYGH